MSRLFNIASPRRRGGICFGILSFLLALSSQARAQDVPAAVARLQLYGWGGVAGTYTGVALGKNAGVTAGADLEFRPFFTLYPAVEIRGLYPIAKGNVVSEENVLAGLRLGRHVHPFSPYGDILFGRGQLNFSNPGYPTPDGNFYVLSNTSNVLSLGAGTDYTLRGGRFGLKGDFQFQKYSSPVTTSGYVYAKVFTLGVVYRIGARGLR